MASIRVTIGSVLDTVRSGAGAATGLLDSVAAGVGMLQARVNAEVIKQDTDLKIELHDHVDVAINRHSILKAERRLENQKFMDKSADHKAQFEKAYSEYEALLKPAKN